MDLSNINRPFRLKLTEHLLKQFSGNLLYKVIKYNVLSLKTLGLHITTACNYNCIYCYAERYKDNKLSLEKLLSLINEAKALGAESVNILGGEPLLNKDLEKIIYHINNKRMRVMLFTNGSLITDSWIKFFKKINKIILIIKYDCEQAVYSKHTRSDYPVTHIEDNIIKLMENKIPVITFTVVTKHNLNFINNILSRSVTLGAYPKLHPYIPELTKSPQLNEELEITSSEWSSVLKRISYVYSPLEELIYALGAFKLGICSCFAHNIYVTADGYCLPCPESPLELNLGNVLETPLKEIWLRFKEKRIDWLKLPTECNGCNNKNACMGGCKVYTYLRFKNFNRKDPLCRDEIPTTYSHCVYALSRILPNEPSYKFLKIIK